MQVQDNIVHFIPDDYYAAKKFKHQKLILEIPQLRRPFTI